MGAVLGGARVRRKAEPHRRGRGARGRCRAAQRKAGDGSATTLLIGASCRYGRGRRSHRERRGKTKYFLPERFQRATGKPFGGAMGQSPISKTLRYLFLEMFGLSLTVPFSVQV